MCCHFCGKPLPETPSFALTAAKHWTNPFRLSRRRTAQPPPDRLPQRRTPRPADVRQQSRSRSQRKHLTHRRNPLFPPILHLQPPLPWKWSAIPPKTAGSQKGCSGVILTPEHDIWMENPQNTVDCIGAKTIGLTVSPIRLPRAALRTITIATATISCSALRWWPFLRQEGCPPHNYAAI